MIDIDALETLAKAATPGPWEYDDADEDMAALGAENQRVKDAAYIAAAILELIAELRQVQAERDWLAKLAANNIPTINDFVRATQGWLLDAAKEATSC